MLLTGNSHSIKEQPTDDCLFIVSSLLELKRSLCHAQLKIEGRKATMISINTKEGVILKHLL